MGALYGHSDGVYRVPGGGVGPLYRHTEIVCVRYMYLTPCTICGLHLHNVGGVSLYTRYLTWACSLCLANQTATQESSGNGNCVQASNNHM